MSNELTDVRCPCGAEFQADSYDAGFIAGSGMCQNCDAALPPKDICTCPSGDGSLRHPCPAHPAVEQACWDERDFQAKGAQEVPSPVSKEYDRHLIGLLRKGEALPGHQEEAADEIERLRDWNDHLNNTVLPNILNPNFLMLMKGGERLLDLCTKDGKFIGVSLNDMKDVFDWMVTHARIAPDHAALAQPSPAPKLERPEVYDSGLISMLHTDKNVRQFVSLEQYERIVGALRALAEREYYQGNLYLDRARMAECELEAAQARVAELELKLDKSDYAYDNDRIHMRGLAARAIARAKVFDDGSDGADAESARSVVAILRELLAVGPAQAQHSVPGDIMRDAQRYRWLRDQQFYFSFSTENSDAGISSCTAGMSSRFKNLSWVDAAIDSAIAAAPGKEVGHE
ncbi:hypothetical protein [Pseudomonas aeruginosa]|uniref:hypothetical protein n=1 Tax=Pseudomonas aeruginosa TaxID=287 RepID=UPI001653AD71|nr:hypothetical protein [Pseudomonas aeruginosa]ELT5290408.1 hypothetical protein [Pseudomonas aeruginosa]MCU8941947.1 hypothetical protein [Pseudomonas aeruginosa]